ncbi:unnamed protein product, partial [Prorocentrum cordatum]
MASKDKDILVLCAHALVFFAPNMCELSWAEALGALRDEIDRLDFLTLCAIGEFFRDSAAASLRDIAPCWADRRGASSFDNVWLLALDELPSDGAVYFWSLLDKANNAWAKLMAEGQ